MKPCAGTNGRRIMNTEDALSRNSIIVIVLSIILIVAAAGAMIYFSSSPDKVPRMNATVEASGNVVYLYHDGGDQFPKDRLLVRINGEDLPDSQVTLLHSQTWPWTSGKTIKVQYSGRYQPGNGPGDLQERAEADRHSLATITQWYPGSGYHPGHGCTIHTIIHRAARGYSGREHAGTTRDNPWYPAYYHGHSTGDPYSPAGRFCCNADIRALPLDVQFTDLSTGIPTKWSWNFGDGSVSTERTPLHRYTTPGSDTVSLVVENKFGSDKKSIPGYISAGIAPVANFAASPRDGTAPLEVHFTDLSTGQPVVWSWDFGDGVKSSESNPTHIYSSGGSYHVTLTVANSYGADTRIKNSYISTTTSPSHDVYLYGSTSGYLAPEGYIAFTATTTDSWVKIAGRIYQFVEGDNVQLIIMDPSSGEIDASSSAITGFNFNKVTMYVNGALVQEGIVTAIGITGTGITVRQRRSSFLQGIALPYSLPTDAGHLSAPGSRSSSGTSNPTQPAEWSLPRQRVKYSTKAALNPGNSSDPINQVIIKHYVPPIWVSGGIFYLFFCQDAW